MLNSDRFDTCPEVRSAIREFIEQLRHKNDPMDVGQLAWSHERDDEVVWEDFHAIGHAKGKSNGMAKRKRERTQGWVELRWVNNGSRPVATAAMGRAGARRTPNTSRTSATVAERRDTGPLSVGIRGEGKGNGKKGVYGAEAGDGRMSHDIAHNTLENSNCVSWKTTP